jgi:hypothetical protein
MFKASDFVKGKMNEIFTSARYGSVQIKHQQHGEYELVSDMKLDGMLYFCQVMVADLMYLAVTKHGFKWSIKTQNSDEMLTHDEGLVAATEEAFKSLGTTILDESYENVSVLDKYHFKTKSDAIDAFLSAVTGIYEFDFCSHKDIDPVNIH